MPPRKKKSASEQESLTSVISELRGAGTQIGSYYDDHASVSALSTGNLTIDALTDIGGIPRGRVTEALGPPGSGKTSLALHTAAAAQAAGEKVLYLDYERALDPEYCSNLGLDVYAEESFLYLQPDHFEHGANIARRLVATGEVALVVFDSVATMVTEHELTADTGKVQVADRAKMMHQFLRQFNPLIVKHRASAFFINHQMDLVDATFIGQKLAAQGIKRKTSPGGQAIPYYASLRLQFNQIGTLKTRTLDELVNEEADVVSQVKTNVTTIKNKVGRPLRQAEVRVRFGKGFSQAHAVLTTLTAYGNVKKSGAWFKFPDPETRLDDDNTQIQGEEAVLSLLEANPEWLSRCEAKARSYLFSEAQAEFADADPADVPDEDEDDEQPTG